MEPDIQDQELVTGISTDAPFWQQSQEDELPIWKKPLLTVVEAAKYFQIGELNLRRITREYNNEEFIHWMDNRVYIRRKPFEEFLDKRNEI